MKRKPRGYWTKERVLEEAIKYEYKIDFRNNSFTAYKAAKNYGWYDEVCQHMKFNRKKYSPSNKKIVYVYEFEDNHVYVGLTNNMKRRNHEHQNENNSHVFNHSNKTSLIPNLIILTTEPVICEEAANFEINYIKKYRENGWILLNNSDGGELGCRNWKWTKENILKEAKKYNTRTEFQNNLLSAYEAAVKNGWYEEACAHMLILRKPKRYWQVKENVLEEAKKYVGRTEFRDKSISAYREAKKNDWLDEAFPFRKSRAKKYTN